MQLGAKMRLYASYQGPLSISIEDIRQSSLLMVNIHNQVYGLRNSPLVMYEEAVGVRHRQHFENKDSGSSLKF